MVANLYEMVAHVPYLPKQKRTTKATTFESANKAASIKIEVSCVRVQAAMAVEEAQEELAHISAQMLPSELLPLLATVGRSR